MHFFTHATITYVRLSFKDVYMREKLINKKSSHKQYTTNIILRKFKSMYFIA